MTATRGRPAPRADAEPLSPQEALDHATQHLAHAIREYTTALLALAEYRMQEDRRETSVVDAVACAYGQHDGESMPVGSAFLTPDEAAERLRVHRNTIYRAVERGDLPARRVGQQIRIPIEALTGPGQEVVERALAATRATRRRTAAAKG